MRKTAAPNVRPEPGGEFTYTVEITNLGDGGLNLPIVLTGLVDDPYGDVTDPDNPDITTTTCTDISSDPLDTVVVEFGVPYSCQFTADFGPEPGFLVDEVTVTTGADQTLADDAAIAVADVRPSGTLTKTATPAAVPEPGGEITYTVEVANGSAAEELYLTELYDDVHGDITDDTNPDIVSTDCSLPQTIAVGGSYSCEFSALHFGAVGETQTDYVFGRLEDNDGNDLDLYDDAAVTFSDIPPVFSIVKTPTPSTVPEPGGSVRYSVVVTNDSVEPVTIASLVDDQEGTDLDLNGQGSCLTPQTIQPGEDYTCSFPRDVAGDSGVTVPDTIIGVGYDDEGNIRQYTGDALVTITPTDPVLTVSKTADPSWLNEPGGDVVYTVTITNDSVETDPVFIQRLVDSVEGATAEPPDDLACVAGGADVTLDFWLVPGESATCTFSGTVEGDVGFSVSDTFTAEGIDDELTPASGSGSENVPIVDVLPTMNVTKTADPNPVPEPGGPVVFTVAIENTSLESIFVTSIYDDVGGPQRVSLETDCLPEVPYEIPAGETYSCMWDGSVSGDAGDIRSNIVTVTANDNEGNVVEESSQADVDIINVNPEIRAFKTAEPDEMPEPGGDVVFTVFVINDSFEPVVIQSLDDVPYGDLTTTEGDIIATTCELPQTLVGNGGFYACTFRAPVIGTAALSPYVDVFTAIATDNEDRPAEAEAREEVVLTNVDPAITVVKSRAFRDLPEPGGIFTYPVSVTNESPFEDVVLTSLVDDPYGDITVVQGDITRTTCVDLPVTLVPDETYDCEFDAEFLGNAGESLRNWVTGTANDDENTVVTDRDAARVFITDLPSEIVVTKATVPEPTSVPEPGAWVEFSITVDNVSVADEVTIDTLSDDVFGDITQDQAGLVRNTTCSVTPPIVLAPADPSGTADTYDCTFEGFVSGSAVDLPHRDVVTASGVDDDGADVDASDDAEVEIIDVLPTIVVDKTASSTDTMTPADEATLDEPGGEFTFSVSVTNTSVEDVTITSLTDSIYGDLTDGGNPALTSTTCTDAIGTVLAAPVPPEPPGGSTTASSARSTAPTSTASSSVTRATASSTPSPPPRSTTTSRPAAAIPTPPPTATAPRSA